MKAIRGGTVYTMAGPPIENGTVLISNGKITAVGGPELPVPAEAQCIDAAGCWVTPGFIDAHSHLALWGEPEMKATADENEMTDPITPHVRARDGINPNDIAIPKVRAAGFTAVYTGPGSGNVIGGLGACIKLRGVTADEMIIPGTEQMKMALGENPKRVYGEKNKFPMTRMGTAAILRQTLSRARRYAEKLADAEKDPAKAPEPDFLLESLVPVVRGETRARIHCHRADDIATAIRICEEFGLTYSLEHVTEGWKVAGLLAEKQVECVLGPLLLGPVKQEVWDCWRMPPFCKRKAFASPSWPTGREIPRGCRWRSVCCCGMVLRSIPHWRPSRSIRRALWAPSTASAPLSPERTRILRSLTECPSAIRRSAASL